MPGCRCARSRWTAAWFATALTVPLAVLVLSREPSSPSPWPVLLVVLGIAVAESLTLQFEFRKQTFQWTASELALVIALVVRGGAWAAAARGAARAESIPAVRPGCASGGSSARPER